MEFLITALFLVIFLTVSVYLGIVLSVHLPQVSYIFDRKPFNCSPCLTFHLVWISNTIFALVCQSYKIAIVGFIFAFALFLIVKYIDNKKIVK